MANGETTTTDEYFYFISDNLLIVLFHLCHYFCLLPYSFPPIRENGLLLDAFIASENLYNRFHTEKHIKKGRNFNSPAVYLLKDEEKEAEESIGGGGVLMVIAFHAKEPFV